MSDPQQITVNDFVCAVGEMTNADALQRVKELVLMADDAERSTGAVPSVSPAPHSNCVNVVTVSAGDLLPVAEELSKIRALLSRVLAGTGKNTAAYSLAASVIDAIERIETVVSDQQEAAQAVLLAGASQSVSPAPQEQNDVGPVAKGWRQTAGFPRHGVQPPTQAELTPDLSQLMAEFMAKWTNEANGYVRGGMMETPVGDMNRASASVVRTMLRELEALLSQTRA